MLAIPVFRSRVAPVLDWCSKVLLFPEGVPDSSLCEEIALTDVADSFERLRALKKMGVTTLVCGALSADLLRYAENLKLRVICGVAGGVPDVLDAYKEGRLDQPRFWLPGCRCKRRFSADERMDAMSGRQGGGSGQGQGQGKGRGREQGGAGRMGGKGAGPAGSCLCPHCGTAAVHERGIPCAQMKCPQCGQSMTRQ